MNHPHCIKTLFSLFVRPVCLLFFLGLNVFSSSVYAYYCGVGGQNKFIQPGDTIDAVEAKCGSPDRIETCEQQVSASTSEATQAQSNTSFIQPSGFNNLDGQGSATTSNQGVNQPLKITIFEYHQGPHLASVFLAFHNGRLYEAPLNVSEHPCSSF